MRRLLSWVLISMLVVPTVTGSRRVSAALDGSRFVPLSPNRVLDSRPGAGDDDLVEGVVAPGGVITVQIAGRKGVPASDVTAVVLNVAVVDATGPGFVQVLPTGQAALGSSSNLNVEVAGQTIANQVTVPLGDGGKVSVYMPGGGHVIADVFGYFTPVATATAGRFVPLGAPSPRRVLDTRDPLQFPIANPGDTANCGSFAAWDDAWRWFWTYRRWGDPGVLDGNNDGIPCESLPGTKTASAPTDLFKIAPGGTVRFPILTGTDVPGGVSSPGQASAVVANVTVTEATGVGYWQVLPTNGAPIGSSSNLNVTRSGQTISNQVSVPIGADGTITIYSQSGGHVLVDVAGVFTGTSSPSSTSGLFMPVTPARLIDTRDPNNTPVIGPLSAGALVSVQTANRFGVPGGAAAVSLNATMTESRAAGYVQLFAPGASTPGASSNLNVERANQTIPNAVYSTLDGSGQFNMFTQTGGHLVADVSGWFSS